MDISIIVPFYFGNKYVLDLLTSIKNSCEKASLNLEVIIINDSPDEHIINILDKFPFPITILSNELNMGIQKSRVRGLSVAKGDYVVFLDQDDLLLEGFIDSQFKLINEEKFDIVIGNAVIETEVGSHLYYRTYFSQDCSKDIYYYQYINNQIFSPGQCLIKKSAIPDFWKNHCLDQNGADDLMLWLLMFEKKAKIKVNYDPVYVHRYTGENLSNDLDKMYSSVLEMIYILRKYQYFINSNILDTLYHAQTYKNKFRKGSYFVKIILSMKYLPYFYSNACVCIRNIISKRIKVEVNK